MRLPTSEVHAGAISGVTDNHAFPMFPWLTLIPWNLAPSVEHWETPLS
jgi:hypothetical protein